MEKSHNVLWQDFCFLLRFLICNPIKEQQRVRKKCNKRYPSDQPHTQDIRKEDVTGGKRMLLDFSSNQVKPAFHLEAAEHLSPGEHLSAPCPCTTQSGARTLKCGVGHKQYVRCLGTKVQNLPSLSAQKASHSAFLSFFSWENGREDYVDRSFYL